MERFLARCLAHCTSHLGRWQLASEPPVYPHRWFSYGHPAEVCQFIYNHAAVTDIVIAADEKADPYVTVYVPLGKLENAGGTLITDMYESCTYIPPMIWLEYIVPQMAYMQTLFHDRSYFEISPSESVYCTEGKVFRGSNYEEANERISDTRHRIVPTE